MTLAFAALVAASMHACLVDIPELESKAADAGGGSAGDLGMGAAGASETPEPTPPAARCSVRVEALAPIRRFPADSGVIDVTQPPYSAQGDGLTDDTAALQAAISDHAGTNRIVWLPSGTYVVSAPLQAVDTAGESRSPLTVQGESRDETTLVVADGASAFDDVDNPAPVLAMGLTNVSGSTGQGRGNYVRDLSIDVGTHAGAVGLDFVGHDSSGVENVAIYAEPGAGVVGLALDRPRAGSRLIRNVRVDGFDVGIRIGQERYGNTLEHIELRGQRTVGLLNQKSFASIRDLQSENAVPALINDHALGMVVLVEADLLGGDSATTAIESEGELFARDIESEGYESSLTLRGRVVATGALGEFSSREPDRLAASGAGSLGLHIEEPPEPDVALDEWRSVAEFGALPDDAADDTEALRAAFDSRARAIYLPFGEYLLSGTIAIPAAVEHVFGAGSTLSFGAGHEFVAAGAPQALFSIEPGTLPLWLERLYFTQDVDAPDVNAALFAHEGARTVALSAIEVIERTWPLLYRGSPGAGDVYLSNVHGGGVLVDEGQRAWLRAVNLEHDQPMVDNRGGTVWALGLKAYTPHTVLATSLGGKSELLGAFLLPQPVEDTSFPAFIVDEAEASFVFTTKSDELLPDFDVYVEETRAGETRELLPEVARVVGVGGYVPLFVSHDRDARLCQ